MDESNLSFTSAEEEFQKFLSEISDKQKENLQGSLISFATHISGFSFEQNLDQLLKSSESSFYFSSPESNLSFVALNEVFNIEESGQGRFAATDKKLKELKPKFISNWKVSNLPLFIAAMKFNVEHSDDDWKDFNDSSWYVPEIIICSQGSESFLIYNYFNEQGFSVSKILDRFGQKTGSLSKYISQKKSGYFPKIIDSNGLSPKDKKKWKLLINKALEEINENNLNKIVLARRAELVLSEELNLTKALTKLKNDNPLCYIFAYHRGKSTFFGASPELMLQLSVNALCVDAMAGSAKRGKSEKDDEKLSSELASSKKELEEHKFVLEYINSTLSNFADDITFNENPSVKKFSNIQHLATRVTAELREDVSVLNILKELHPTPAVCGHPKDAALNLIKKIESHNRGLYSGIIGWLNFNNNGEFAVAIRSAVTYGNKLIAYSGSGIVDGSEPDSEFEETEIKLKPILSLFDEKQE